MSYVGNIHPQFSYGLVDYFDRRLSAFAIEEAAKEAVKEAAKKAFEASFKDCPDDLLAEREAIAAVVAKSKKYEDEDHDKVVLASDSDLAAAVDHARTAGWFEEVLTSIGTIEDIRVQRDKGFGFVRYSTHEEAALSIQMGNARILFGKPIKR
ncbi:hypothetical protein RIF29_00474 [Crotalaria pallida]|uniref:RRM domain-containing protein n=1 Tax=Crotalaria pallida TaxID=3830 RepID=A0AAN9IXI7_CROPI